MLGPVFRHEMLAAGRRTGNTILRVLVGALLLVLLLACYEGADSMSYGPTRGAGLSIRGASQLVAGFYASFAWTVLLAVVCVTPPIVAGAIASERQRRTIEYLFATDLSNAEIVLGKLAARLMVVGQFVAAALPFLAIVGLYAGLPWRLPLGLFALITSTALLVTGISLVVSTWSERPRTAVPSAIGWVAGWFFAAPIAWWIGGLLDSCGHAAIAAPVMTAAQALTSVNAFAAGWGSGVLGRSSFGVDYDPRVVAWLCGWQVALAAVCVALCVWQVRRVHLRSASAGVAPEENRPKASTRRLATRAVDRYEARPLLWKEMFAPSLGGAARPRWRSLLNNALSIGVALLIVGTLLWPLLMAFGGASGWERESFFQSAAWMTGLIAPIVLLRVGVRAAGLFTYEKERDTWLSLLSTPIEARDMVRDKFWGNLYASRWGLAATLLPAAMGVALRPIALVSVAGVALTVAACSMAATAIGLVYSLRIRSSTKAIGATIATLVFLGGAYLPFAAFFVEGLARALDGYEELLFVGFAPCVPYLAAAPVLVSGQRMPSEMGILVAAYGLGVVGYAALAMVLLRDAIDRFDVVTQRGEGRFPTRPRFD
jgi:ABC-type transport system involved in multi-copper enzyme maturation permease subunit